MPSIHPHGSGFRVHYWRDGKPGKSPTLPNRPAAEAWIVEHLPAVADTSWANLVDLWRQEQPSPYREDVYQQLEHIWKARRWSRPQDLTLADLKAWMRDSTSWRRPLQYLRTVLAWAAREHRVPVRPDIFSWKPPRQSTAPPGPLLTDAQANLLRDRAATMGPRALAVIDYLMTYGARPITACRLLRRHLDDDAGELVLPNEKHSGGWRHVVFQHHLDAWDALTVDWPGAREAVPLFPHYEEDRLWRIDRGRAGELASWYVNRISRPVRASINGLIGIYHLKRYAVTTMLGAGTDIGTAASFTGHRHHGSLLRYARSNAERQAQALERIAAVHSQKRSHVPTEST